MRRGSWVHVEEGEEEEARKRSVVYAELHLFNRSAEAVVVVGTTV